MTSDFILQFQYTMHTDGSPRHLVHCTLIKCSRQHNWLKILVSLHGCSNEDRKLDIISPHQRVTFGGNGYRNRWLASHG